MVEDVERTLVRPKRRRRKTLYFTSRKREVQTECEKEECKQRREINLLSTVEKTVKVLDFDAIEDDEGAKNKEHVDDRISESELKTSSKKTTNKKISQFNIHII
jgi:hypothetical protein